MANKVKTHYKAATVKQDLKTLAYIGMSNKIPQGME